MKNSKETAQSSYQKIQVSLFRHLLFTRMEAIGLVKARFMKIDHYSETIKFLC
jgi:hypothetical protein